MQMYVIVIMTIINMLKNDNYNCYFCYNNNYNNNFNDNNNCNNN